MADLFARNLTVAIIPIWARYLLTILIVMVCFAARQWIGDAMGHYPYLLFLPGILVASFLFDRGSGFLAVGFSGALAFYFFVPPVASFDVPEWSEWIALIVFIVTGTLVAVTVEALRKANHQLHEATAKLRSSNAERQLLLDDINHRIKNHLASVSGLLVMNGRRIEDVASARQAFELAASQIGVLARVYDRLHLSGEKSVIGSRMFIEGLCRDLKTSVATGRPIIFQVEADDVEMSSNRAVTIGLIINELIQNALKYAFPHDREGTIRVAYRVDDDHCHLEVSDDGVGSEGGSGSGQRLIKRFVQQLGGQADWHGPPGTRVVMHIPFETSGASIF